MKRFAPTSEIPNNLIALLDELGIPFAHSGYAHLQETLEFTKHRLLAATMQYETSTGDATLSAKVSSMNYTNVKTITLFAAGTQTLYPQFINTKHQKVLQHNKKIAQLSMPEDNNEQFPITDAIVLANPIINEPALFNDDLCYTEEFYQILAVQTLSKQWLAFRDPAIAHNIYSQNVIKEWNNMTHKTMGTKNCRHVNEGYTCHAPGWYVEVTGTPGCQEQKYLKKMENDLHFTGFEMNVPAFREMSGIEPGNMKRVRFSNGSQIVFDYTNYVGDKRTRRQVGFVSIKGRDKALDQLIVREFLDDDEKVRYLFSLPGEEGEIVDKA